MEVNVLNASWIENQWKIYIVINFEAINFYEQKKGMLFHFKVNFDKNFRSESEKKTNLFVYLAANVLQITLKKN